MTDDQYPHEIIIQSLKHHVIRNKVLWKVFRLFCIISGFGLLIISTAGTTMLLLGLPRNPELSDGVLAGIIITGMLGSLLHLMLFEDEKL